MIGLSPRSPPILSLLEANAMCRTKVWSYSGPLFLSIFLMASIASTPALHAQAPADVRMT